LKEWGERAKARCAFAATKLRFVGAEWGERRRPEASRDAEDFGARGEQRRIEYSPRASSDEGAYAHEAGALEKTGIRHSAGR